MGWEPHHTGIWFSLTVQKCMCVRVSV
jgi:hypothetical protein